MYHLLLRNAVIARLFQVAMRTLACVSAFHAARLRNLLLIPQCRGLGHVQANVCSRRRNRVPALPPAYHLWIAQFFHSHHLPSKSQQTHSFHHFDGWLCKIALLTQPVVSCCEDCGPSLIRSTHAARHARLAPMPTPKGAAIRRALLGDRPMPNPIPSEL